MPKIVSKISDPDIKDEVVTGFLGGLNVFQDETVIKDSELTEAKNILLSVDGIEPRPGTDYYGSSVGSKVLGGFGFYKSNGTREFLRFCKGSNNKLQKYVSGTPTDIGTATYDADAPMNFVQARDKVFIFNGVDALSYYDGSSITEYSALTTPTGLGVTATGTTGSTSYSYRVSAFNSVGETLACASVTISNGNATLDATNYNALAWSAVTGATGYNIWGRTATGLGETYLGTVYGVVVYNDKGQDDPSLSLLPPEANSTAGIIAKKGIFAISRVFAAGDPSNQSRLYFGGSGENIGNFSGSSIGGGGVDVFKNDGSIIRDIIPFQGGVIVMKDNAIYKFSFTDEGLQKLEEITRSFGGISFRGSMHVENDIIFPAKKDGRLAFYSLGNQENYAGSVLRTNELSIKVADRLKDVNVARLQYVATFYYKNIFGCAVSTEGSSTNDRIWCLDTRFGAWVYWEGISANCFIDYTDSDGNQNLYYGDETSGYIKKMFVDTKSDAGNTVIDVEWMTKSFMQKAVHKYKQYYNPFFQFKDVTTSGALEGEIILDGQIVDAAFTVNQQTNGGAGVGAQLPGFMLPGDAEGGTVVTGLSSDIPVEVKTTRIARAIKYRFRSSNAGADYKFLSLVNSYAILPEKRIKSTYRVYPS